MAKHSPAYQLIKNMTMSEKRYFKIFSKRHIIGTKNKYQVLFDYFDSAAEENTEQAIAWLEKKGIKADFFAADRNHLYNLILLSLNQFHHSRSLNFKIKNDLQTIEVLFYKGLYSDCLQVIQAAEKKANQCENFMLLLDILFWKKQCTGYFQGLKKAADVNKQVDMVLAKMKNLQDIIDLYYKSYQIQTNNENNITARKLATFRTLLRNPLLKQEKNALSTSAKIYFLLIHFHYQNLLGKKAKELFYLKKLLSAIEKSETYKAEHPLDYISIFNRYIEFQKKGSNRKMFMSSIEQLRQFGNTAKFDKEVFNFRIFVITTTHEIDFLANIGEYSTAAEKLEAGEKYFRNSNVTIEPFYLINYYYYAIAVYMLAGKYNKALEYTNECLNRYDFSNRPQVFARIEILNILIHFRLGNLSLLQYLAKSLNYRYKKIINFSRTETSILHVISKQIKKTNWQTEKKNIVEEKIISELKALIPSDAPKKISEFDSLFLKWIGTL